MAKKSGIFRALVEILIRIISSSSSTSSSSPRGTTKNRPTATLNPQPRPPTKGPTRPGSVTAQHGDGVLSAGQMGLGSTKQVTPPTAGKLTISYSPRTDGDPDAGEVIWTWVPYEENDGRGKDRPVLVIGRHGTDRVYAVRLTSKSHDGDRDYLSIGTGAWDPQGRPSWVDIDQVYSVHVDGMRREAAALDLKRFAVIADALVKRYGWKVSGS